LSCDPYQRPPIGFALFMLVLSAGVTFLPWSYHYVVLPLWVFIDPANPLPTSTPIWIGIGSVVGLVCQAALSMVKLWIDKKERQDDADRKERLEKDERDRKDARDRAEADRTAGLDELHHQLDDMKRDMDRVAREAKQKVDDAARELRRRDDEAEAERRQLASEKEALKQRVSELEKTVPPIEARAADTAAKTAVIQAEVLKQNILPKADPTRAPDAPRHTLVIAEDDPAWVGPISGSFLAMGFDVRTAVTLGEALALVDKAPHFAIVDLKLAGEDGMRVIEAIREKNLHTEVVVFTAADDERLDRAIEVVGRDRVIQKGPLDAGDKLIARIKRIMEERRRQAGI
jgi:CheY-like chemotaxis protein